MGFLGVLVMRNFMFCQSISLFMRRHRNIQERPALCTLFKIATAYFREQGLVPVFENSHCKFDEIMNIEVIKDTGFQFIGLV